MPTQVGVEIPKQVLDYLEVHHIITLGTASFTGMPHAATVAYASSPEGVYFSMRPEEATLRNIDANHWASFTIDDYTADFRKVREMRGVGRCGPVRDRLERQTAIDLFRSKLPNHPAEALQGLHRITPIEMHFVDFEYTAGVSVPMESTIVYRAASSTEQAMPAAMSTQLQNLVFEPGQIIVRQGERSERFFIVVEGEVEVRREGHGQDVVVTRHGTGQMFGEVGALTGSPQSATFIAVKPTIVMSINKSSFQDFVSQTAVADLGQRMRTRLSEREQKS